MGRNYWLDLFTGKTWEEFLKHGAAVSGFGEHRRKMCEKIKPGDYLMCYLTGLSRFVGVLEVKSEMFMDNSKIWEDADFSCRFRVELIYRLEPGTAVPVSEVSDKLAIFKNLKSPNAWTGFFRASPALFKARDGEVIVEAVKESVSRPLFRKYSEKKYWRMPRTFESRNIGIVTVPDETQDDAPRQRGRTKDGASHEEIQWLLLKLGSDLGLDVWVARNDRNREFNGESFQKIPSLRRDLPRQFDEATNRTIELIDVLWLQGDAIVAAFEVEHTSSIYSGLLRMSDLVSMQPNIKLNLYLVAPDERRGKVSNEINRPTFARLKPPLPKICKFISYSRLKKEIEEIGNRMRFIKPEFIDEIAERCEPDES